MFKRIGAMTVVFLWSGTVFAAHPLITDDTGTQGKGKFQLEVNGEYAHEDEDGERGFSSSQGSIHGRDLRDADNVRAAGLSSEAWQRKTRSFLIKDEG